MEKWKKDRTRRLDEDLCNRFRRDWQRCPLPRQLMTAGRKRYAQAAISRSGPSRQNGDVRSDVGS